jgi:hypothetical protein
MSYQERRSLVNLISDVVITVIYSIKRFQSYPETNPYSQEIFQFWGSFFLLLIVVSIVAKIIIYIIFSIINTIATNEQEPSITDERDKLIGLKATRNSFYFFAGGFALGMGSLAFDQSPTTMFIILFSAGFLASVVNDISEFYFYRRGV